MQGQEAAQDLARAGLTPGQSPYNRQEVSGSHFHTAPMMMTTPT